MGESSYRAYSTGREFPVEGKKSAGVEVIEALKEGDGVPDGVQTRKAAHMQYGGPLDDETRIKIDLDVGASAVKDVFTEVFGDPASEIEQYGRDVLSYDGGSAVNDITVRKLDDETSRVGVYMDDITDAVVESVDNAAYTAVQ